MAFPEGADYMLSKLEGCYIYTAASDKTMNNAFEMDDRPQYAHWGCTVHYMDSSDRRESGATYSPAFYGRKASSDSRQIPVFS